MRNELRWGFLGNARIASSEILPALQGSDAGRAVAIASRDRESATRTAIQFGIDRIYQDYQALIDDANVDAVYIGLPNSAHAYWLRAAVQAGKHVLCEKPITLSAAELDGIEDLATAQGVLVQEALMVWTHPRWHRVRQLLRDGRIGRMRAVQGRFCFMSRDPNNIRNKADLGGGGLLDLGMYLTSMARFLFEDEPTLALTMMERDPDFHTDRLVSFLLEFPQGQGSFVCSTQLGLTQRLVAMGTRGLIGVETPLTPSSTAGTRLILSTEVESNQLSEQSELIPAANQYATELTAFTEAVLHGQAPAVPLASLFGPRSADEVQNNLEQFAKPIDPALWRTLKKEQLVRADAPTP
jgi:predicted dehydrogenase